MLYSIEYKRGASPDDFDSLSSLNEEREYDIDWEGINKVLQNNQNQEKKDEEEEISFLDEVRNRYYGGNNPSTLGASRAIMEYIKTGELNEVQLETEIQNSLSLIRNQMGSKTQQLLGQMNQFLILEDAELRKLAKKYGTISPESTMLSTNSFAFPDEKSREAFTKEAEELTDLTEPAAEPESGTPAEAEQSAPAEETPAENLSK
jgi:hypothetical protein